MLLVSQKFLILKYNKVNFSENLLPTPTLNVNTVNPILGWLLESCFWNHTTLVSN